MATLLHDSVIYYSKLSTSFQKLSDEKGHGVTYSVGSNRKICFNHWTTHVRQLHVHMHPGSGLVETVRKFTIKIVLVPIRTYN